MVSNVQDVSKFKALISSLDPQKSNDKKVQLLRDITEAWKFKEVDIILQIIKASKLFKVLTDVMEENRSTWIIQLPTWIPQLMGCFSDYTGIQDLFPPEQFIALEKVLQKYIVGGCLAAIQCLPPFAGFTQAKQLLVTDDELLNSLKQSLDNKDTQATLRNITAWYELGQLKVLEDKMLILQLIALPESPVLWGIFANIAQHSDSKTLMPLDVLIKASTSTHIQCIDICLLLCSDENLQMIKMGDEWIQQTVQLLDMVLVNANGKSLRRSSILVKFNLLELILPIANLSAIDSQKETIGNRVVPHLMRVITNSMTDDGRNHVTRGRQEASRALWNFAFLESNRALVFKDSGTAKLNKTLSETSDTILKRNIEGILYMLSPPSPKLSTFGSTRHIMISYNQGNQATVKRLAKSLKGNGCNVWLDADQTAGSTAIEGAELVLMCIGQKYKDFPNCRLEAEYCMNRRIAFIPLLMQQGYKPDGWLGTTLGTKPVIDFSDENNWDAKISDLIKVIGGGEISPPSCAKAKKPLISWHADEVLEWMEAEHLDQHFELFMKHKLHGRALSELKYLYSISQPAAFLQFIQHQLGIVELGDMLCLSEAIRKL